ncbi:TIGR02302 family protein [Rhizobium sp. TH2]|uniref:TIGR02302 family protein n=1 Tax=Rhizobium sp. TH2 TaxID=2775403 RepID=UPI002157C1E0|nr:TIGR02302 family protein [Rhizobium sp. TH2]UVC08281.1 TIGR02302 family protein [Rhizobium sp. TH2]
MADDVTTPPDNRPDYRIARLRRLIAGKRALALTSIVLERALISALPVLSVIALFLVLSWMGVMRQIPDLAKIAVGIVFFAGFIVSLLPLRKFVLPTVAEADRRLEDRSGLAHQAISVQAETPVSKDPYSLALWKSHQVRMAEKIKSIDAGLPSPDIARHDPLAFRAALILALVVAWSFSFSNYGGRITDAFSLTKPVVPVADIRIDAWVTPPSYTGVAPLYLSGNLEKAAPGELKVPLNSELTIRISGKDAKGDVRFTPVTGPAVDLKAEAPQKKPATSANAEKMESRTYKVKLIANGKVSVASKEYAFTLIPDKPPQISFAREPGRALNGALELAFQVKDDYGVTEARAEILPTDNDPKAIPLFDPPKFPLDLPGSDGRQAKSTVSRDLTEHPLSGRKVRLTLVAKDAGGLEGRSETKEIVLPARYFSELLAGSVAEQRQVFALDVNDIPRALELNDAATFRADETIPNLTNFLLVKSARSRLVVARGVEGLTDAAKYFWDIARYIEDGDLSTAEKRLRDAQEKLSDALKRDAPDAEIAKLMAELRQAMKEYLSEMAKRMQNQDNSRMSQQAQRMMRSQDFENMLNQLENLSRSGNKDEAQKLLSEMQRMLNNLQTARPRQQPGQENNPVREQIDKLGKLMQDQQKLMEETHRMEQALRDRMQRGDPDQNEEGLPQDQQEGNQQQPGEQQKQDQQPGGDQKEMTAEQLREALKQLRSRQEQLQKDLKGLEQGLADLGMKAPKGFKGAGEEMGESSDALGKSQGQRSADAQGRALQALRDGAGEMMQQLQQMQADQEGRDGQGMPLPGSAMNNQGNDPLGRKTGQLGSEFDDSVKVPDQIDVQRAREILEEIRRRLGNGPSSLIEREYLERLLDLR